jgi:heme/copper-type cytochrome/quinol oxidase subunit 2
MTVSLADAAFWLAVACCTVAQVAIVRSAFARRSPLETSGPMPPLRRPIEVAWTIVPAIMLALVLALTWRAMHEPADIVIVDAPAAVSGGVGAEGLR